MKAIKVLVGTFVHQVIRRHKVVHIIKFRDGVEDQKVTRENAKDVIDAWVRCECGRLWAVK